ncbi:2-hydroxyacid dehydrogenase family protein [Salipiger pallidus]|uniref:2-hydroxyacid dehydrogenase family protein n=1 Tax=Salipiger pallidus TaxID=1775170 RepID=A0A8J2ZJF7_9RHOB|nr:2-hydroxyacid dehydrogenase [Salipiger pallidus]GGG72261.1 2-hydroxyacid dehydrogenase family protein [Salipiger pallidus]
MPIGPVAVLEPASPGMRARIEQLCDGFDLRFVSSVETEDMRAALDGAAYAVTRGLRFPAELLAEAGALKMVHQWGTGVDGIPLDTAKARGVTVARSPGMNAPTVAEATLALMLATLRRLPQVQSTFRGGAWNQPDLWREARDLGACKVGLVGMGAIGKEVLKRLSGFGCEIAYTKRSGADAALGTQFMSFDDLLGWADVISLHLPMTADSRHLIDAGAIAAMKPGAVLINTSRGGLVDEAALIAALQSGQIGAAGLDVFETEPVNGPNPLLEMPNTVTLPHVAGRTLDNFDRMVRHWSGNIRAHAEGRAIDPACIVLP